MCHSSIGSPISDRGDKSSNHCYSSLDKHNIPLGIEVIGTDALAALSTDKVRSALPAPPAVGSSPIVLPAACQCETFIELCVHWN